ncbi:MAG: hypothetical protein ABIF08_02310 [Nanoarchaeota archaeon]
MDDFMWVLAAAFLILIAMFFVSFIPGIGLTGGEDLIEVDTFRVGAVGRVSQFPTSTIDLGSFTVGETQTELLKAVPMMTVYSGLGGAESKKYEINIPEGFGDLAKREAVAINFDVSESNLYGDLVVKWNGKEFMRKRASPRQYTIVIPKEFVKASNNIEIYPEGPGLIFWASTTYTIKNFDIALNYGPSKIFSFQLNQDEIESWLKGRVDFFATSQSGEAASKLIIKVNGDEIYSVKPDGSGLVEFGYSDAPILLGDNLLTFAAQDDTIIMNGVKLKMFLTTSELIKTFNFKMDDAQINLISSGVYKPKVRFYIEQIASGGTLDIKVNGNARQISAMVTGPNNFYIPESYLSNGANIIEFSGTGSWYIGSATIELEKVEV